MAHQRIERAIWRAYLCCAPVFTTSTEHEACSTTLRDTLPTKNASRRDLSEEPTTIRPPLLGVIGDDALRIAFPADPIGVETPVLQSGNRAGRSVRSSVIRIVLHLRDVAGTLDGSTIGGWTFSATVSTRNTVPSGQGIDTAVDTGSDPSLLPLTAIRICMSSLECTSCAGPRAHGLMPGSIGRTTAIGSGILALHVMRPPTERRVFLSDDLGVKISVLRARRNCRGRPLRVQGNDGSKDQRTAEYVAGRSG